MGHVLILIDVYDESADESNDTGMTEEAYMAVLDLPGDIVDGPKATSLDTLDGL